MIALHAAGFEEAVAAMGTSLTEEGVRELRRLADAVLLCFDADAAGQEAALRGMEMAERSGLRVRIVALPAGEDPADILARGPEAFEAALAAAQPVLAFRIGRALDLAKGEEGPDAAYAACRSIIAAAAPGPERDEQVRLVSSALRLSPASEAALVPGRRGGPRMPDTSVAHAPEDQRQKTYHRMLAASIVARMPPDDDDDVGARRLGPRAHRRHGRRRARRAGGRGGERADAHRELRRGRRRAGRGARRRREFPSRATYHRDRRRHR